MHDLDFALLRESRETARQLRDDARFPFAKLRNFDLRLAERDAGVSRFVGFGDHFRDVQQRLGRNAADVQAHAAERRIALDQHRFLAEVGGAKRRGVAAGSGAEHDDFGVDVRFDRGSGVAGSGSRGRRGAGGVPSWVRAGFREAGQAAGLGAAGSCFRLRRLGALLSSPLRLEREDETALGDFVADFDLELAHDAARGRRARPSSPCPIRA